MRKKGTLSAEAIYNLNPNLCLRCADIIKIKDGQKPYSASRKQFCSHKCAGIYRNPSPKQLMVKVPKIEIVKFNWLIGLTKGEVFKKHKNWQSARTGIRRFASYVFNNSGKPKCCEKCNYAKHYEVAHIKAVSEFLDSDLVEDINHISNLIALCPNCHWEHDNKFSGELEILPVLSEAV